MKNSKQTKLMVLFAAILAMAALAFGIYLVSHRASHQDADRGAQSEPTSQQEVQLPGGAANAGDAMAAEGAANLDSTAASVSDGLIHITGGTFLMGSPESENWRGTDEVQHEVTVSSFYVDPYEVRQSDYESVMGENPSHFIGADLPVENLTWYDAVEYCNRLSQSRGLTPIYTVDGDTVSWDRSVDGYRLLTEAEWEYVTRAGTQTIYNFGNQVHSDVSNFEGSYPYNIERNYVSRTDPTVVTSRYRGETIPVDELAPNAFGLYNTHGNVSEWVFDYYGAYDSADTDNPAGARSGSLRVNRGGSYIDFGKQLRSAYRSATNPADTDQNLGFRICRNEEGTEETVATTYSLDISIPDNPGILVAYFSYSGNTADAARIVAEKTGGNLFEITMANPYRGNIYDVSAADLDDYIIPELSSHVDDMSQYDVILLGYPTWWSTLPMPIVAFLEEYDFSGKTIVTFSSHGGTMFGDSVSDLSKLVPEAYVGLGYEFQYSGSDSGEISAWLAENGVPER